jgi:hypothetical protein
MTSDKMNDKSGITTLAMTRNNGALIPNVEAKQQIFTTLINTVLILGGFVVTMFLIYRILKRKRQN